MKKKNHKQKKSKNMSKNKKESHFHFLCAYSARSTSTMKFFTLYFLMFYFTYNLEEVKAIYSNIQ